MTVEIPSRSITAPSITPLVGTLLDAATVTSGIGWLDPDMGLFESFNCLVTDREATWPCPDVFADEPVQAALATSPTGGTVADDTYFFTVTALTTLGETLESNEQTIVTAGGNLSTITVDWAAVSGATGYRIYATSGASGTETFLDSVSAPTTDYVWDGTPAIGTGEPPTANDAIVSTPKTFEAPDWINGIRFGVYAGLLCKFFGSDTLEEALSEAERVFRARESIGVERALMETLFQGATDLTPATPPTPEVGLAILEGHAATLYAGVPTIHAPRSIGSILMTRTAAHAEGGAFFTEQGSKLASGGGYNATNLSPAGAAPAAGTLWMYATGEVVVAQGNLISKVEKDRVSNDDVALVERPNVAAIDCYKAAVRVTVA